jgi:hypothetical protein
VCTSFLRPTRASVSVAAALGCQGLAEKKEVDPETAGLLAEQVRTRPAYLSSPAPPRPAPRRQPPGALLLADEKP